MTQLAKSGAILAKWHGTRLPLGQAALQLEQKRDEFWVNTVGADGIKTDSQRVTMTTGSHHLQVYWTADANGNLQHPFPFGWLIADQKWVPVQDTFLRDPHLAAPDAKWNNVCIKCHAVAGRPGIDARTRTVNTETAELGISCEACHRPAGAHIAHYQNPVNRYISHLSDKAVHAILNPGSETLDHRLSAQACGQCHSYQYTPNQLDWLRNGPRFLPGNELNANTTVVHASTFIANGKQPDGHPHPGGEWLGDRFWPDGMVRVTGREYNGLLDTACFQRGKMSCLSCHSMHGYLDSNDQLAPRMETNEACLQCHDDFRDNLTAHTHHAADSTGSLCYNCHMPHTTYGLLSGIRSHQIDEDPGVGFGEALLAEDVEAGVARGLLGEGTEAHGNMFQVSNQQTLGASEDAIIRKLISTVNEVIQHEQNARWRIIEKRKTHLTDMISRARGILLNCRILSSHEAVDLLSAMRLGVEMKIVGNGWFGGIADVQGHSPWLLPCQNEQSRHPERNAMDHSSVVLPAVSLVCMADELCTR